MSRARQQLVMGQIWHDGMHYCSNSIWQTATRYKPMMTNIKYTERGLNNSGICLYL